MAFANRLEIGEECFEIFITQDDYPEMVKHGVHMSGIATLKPPYLVERTDPSIHTLLFTSEGSGQLVVDGGEYPIEPDSLTVIPAHADFRFEIVGEHWRMCWVLLPLTARWAALMPNKPEVRHTRQALNIFHLSHVIDQDRGESQSIREPSFAKMARYIELNLKAEEDQKDDRLGHAFSVVEQSLHKAWTVADIADLTFYSEPHFYRLCKEQLGRSPKQILRDLRIERAKHLLEQTDWPLAELANRLGFSDQFNFSNRFKKDVGISPSQFRKNAQ